MCEVSGSTAMLGWEHGTTMLAFVETLTVGAVAWLAHVLALRA